MKFSDGEIISKIEQEEGMAYGINDSALSGDRAKAIDYYLGELFGNEVEARSQVISMDVQDTIESALPQLLKIFVSGDKVVSFDPKNPEDVPAAEQETDYINHVVMEKNNGFEVFYVWFKDAILSKNGYVKAYYENEYEIEEEQYEGLTDGQLSLLVSDDKIEVLEHSAYDDPSFQPQLSPQFLMAAEAGMLPPTPQLHDVKIKITETKGRICVENVAPENMMVSVDTKGTNLQYARFVQHRELMCISEISETFNISEKKLEGIASDNTMFDQESNARDVYSEQYELSAELNQLLVKDTYYRINGKLMRYVIVGKEIIYRDEPECIPFACLTPMIMPHRHIGRSYADLTMDIQLTKSALIRGQLDNMYLANNGRYAVSDRVNLDDMLTSRPGGIVRTEGDPGAAIMPLSHPPLPQASFALVEYMDSMKEKRTGVTAYNQGLDSNALNKTASGIAQVMSAAQQRLELVARTFAETGVKDLFLLVHKLVRTNLTKPDIVRLRNQWVEIDPRSWKNRKDLTISVGLGAGNKDQQLMHLTTILNLQKEAIQVGLTDPTKIYNALSKLTQNAGFKNPDEFWTTPQQMQQQQKPTEAEIMVQGQLAIEAQKAQAQMAQEQERSKNDIIIEREKIAAQAELERFKAQLKAETDLAIAQIKAQYQAPTQLYGM